LPFPSGTRIQKLLEADENNAGASVDVMNAFDPAMSELFEQTAGMFQAIIERLGKWSAEEIEDGKLSAIAHRLGLTDQQLIVRLQADPQSQPDDAQAAWARLAALRAIKMLILACQRYWAWAATDLARLRLSTATGYLRLQAEIVGLVSLFLAEPQTADRWFNIRDKKSGRQFFNDTQSKVREVLKAFELDGVYEIASGGSQHVRLAGMVRSVASSGGDLRLADQDVDLESPFNLHLTVAHFHKTQGRIIAALAKLLPDVADEEWPKRWNPFATRINELWAALEKKYTKEMAESGGEPGDG
jgi:hypothetical protein